MSSKERGIGGVVAEAAGEQVELIDKGRGSIEKVDHSEIASGIRHPALPTMEAVAKVKIDRRPRIDATRRHGARISVGAGMVHGRKDRPAPERPREMRPSAASTLEPAASVAGFRLIPIFARHSLLKQGTLCFNRPSGY